MHAAFAGWAHLWAELGLFEAGVACLAAAVLHLPEVAQVVFWAAACVIKWLQPTFSNRYICKL